MKIIGEGAEAKIILLKNNILKKIREEKPYRISQLDYKLRKSRNRREFKVLKKLYENKINVSKPFDLYESKKELYFTFEYLKGELLKMCLNKKLLYKAFENIIKIHNLNIVHGDLTTLNMIVNLKNDKVYLIDFGLSLFSKKIEDMAVDLNLFFNCIKNEHPKFYKYKSDLLEIYKKNVDKSEKVIKRLKEIEKRGRNK